MIAKGGRKSMRRPWRRIDKLFDIFGQDDDDGYSVNGMEDNIPRLSQVYEILAEKVDNLGKILEIAGAERVAGNAVSA